jgi:hypothetical protein
MTENCRQHSETRSIKFIGEPGKNAPGPAVKGIAKSCAFGSLVLLIAPSLLR